MFFEFVDDFVVKYVHSIYDVNLTWGFGDFNLMWEYVGSNPMWGMARRGDSVGGFGLIRASTFFFLLVQIHRCRFLLLVTSMNPLQTSTYAIFYTSDLKFFYQNKSLVQNMA